MVRTLVAGMTLALTLITTAADGKQAPKPAADTVSWAREAGDVNIKMEIGKDTIKLHVYHENDGVVVTCRTTALKDGVMKAKITGVEEKGSFPAKPKEGLEFTFKWKVDGEKATLSELKGDDVEVAKPVLEGEYKKKAKK
jgi:hypothetical protein